MRSSPAYSTPAARPRWLLPLLALSSALAGALVVLWPQAVTLLAGAAAALFVLARPLAGLLLVLGLLYFPIFPNLGLGGLETSITGPLLLLLAAAVLLQRRGSSAAAPPRPAWQKALLGGLALAFALALGLSQDYSVSLRAAPNLTLYLAILFVIPAVIDTEARLVIAAKAILALAFMFSIWQAEFGPLRGLLGLPSILSNPTVFAFHPAIALCLVILAQPGKLFSRRWRLFAGLTLISLVMHGVLLQTRAAWITWILFLLLLALRLPLRHWARYLPLVTLLLGLAGYFYLGTLQANFEQTQTTLTATLAGDDAQMNSGDRIRLVAQQAGLAMFHERPLFGWGPNMYNHLKPEFVTGTSKEARHPNAFNSWLLVLAEMGLVGIFPAALAALLPLLLAWRSLGRPASPARREVQWLAFGFALGAFGLAFHLLFIGLMFSFYWAHVGLAWAAVRLAFGQPQTAPEIKTA